MTMYERGVVAYFSTYWAILYATYGKRQENSLTDIDDACRKDDGRLRKALRSLLELGKYGYCLTWGKVVEIQGA